MNKFLDLISDKTGKIIAWNDDYTFTVQCPKGKIFLSHRKEDGTLRADLIPVNGPHYVYDFGSRSNDFDKDNNVLYNVSDEIGDDTDLIEKTNAILDGKSFPEGFLISFEIEQSVYDALTRNDPRSFDEIMNEIIRKELDSSK